MAASDLATLAATAPDIPSNLYGHFEGSHHDFASVVSTNVLAVDDHPLDRILRV